METLSKALNIIDCAATPDVRGRWTMTPLRGRRRLPRRVKVLLCLGLALALVLAIGGFVLYRVAQHNFHVVSEGLVYRSAQLDAESLAQMVQNHGIKSILNLRGADTANWYNVETNAAQHLGLKHYDFALLAGTELKDEEMDQILAVMGSAPKPLLIHCKSGADRSALAGALYLYGLEGKPAETAGRQLTVFCGHVPFLFWRDTIAMDRSFWRFVANHAQSSGQIPAKFGAALTQPDGTLLSANHAGE